MNGHSPPGYLSAIKITQVVASDSLCAACCPGTGTVVVATAGLCSAFPWSCWLSCLDPASSQLLALLAVTTLGSTCPLLRAGILPSGHARPRGLPVFPATTLQVFSPMNSLPRAHFSIEKLAVVKLGSEPHAMHSHKQGQICNAPFKTCSVLMPKGRSCTVLATVQM